MKRFLFIALTAVAAAFPLKAYDDLPQNLLRHTTDTDAHAFYQAMNALEDEHPDGMSLVTYDSYPDGIKVISRRIDLPGYSICVNGADVYTPIDRICAVFDSITATPDSNRLVIKNINGRNTQTRVYKLRESPDDMTIDLSATSVPGGTSACVIRDGNLVVAQNWTIRTGEPQGKPDMKALNDAIAALTAKDGSYLMKLTMHEQQLNAGLLRSRLRQQKSVNKLECTRVNIPNAPVQDWIDLHHVFMDYVGAEGDISLTYNRNERLVTLVDMAAHRIYAARYYNTRGLYILVGTYTDTPFLPAGWETAR